MTEFSKEMDIKNQEMEEHSDETAAAVKMLNHLI